MGGGGGSGRSRTCLPGYDLPPPLQILNLPQLRFLFHKKGTCKF